MPSNMSFRGFGAEGDADPDGWFDLGFGDELPPGYDPAADALDLGFGDEPMGLDVGYLLIVPPGGPDGTPAMQGAATQFDTLPDDGGVVMTLFGDFPDPTYKVRIKNHFTAETYPPSPLVGCLSVAPGRTAGVLWQIVPLPDKKRLQFVLPAMPPATYDVQVAFGPGYAADLPVISKAFRVVRRHRTLEQYSLRALPPHWNGTGPRVLSAEQKLGGI